MCKIKVETLSKIYGENGVELLAELQPDFDRNLIFEQTGSTIGVYDASFEVNTGEIFVITGLPGSGKSTLARCLNLLVRPSAGRVIIDGEDVAGYGQKQIVALRRDKISTVLQQFGLFAHKTVIENVAFGLQVNGIPKEQRIKQAAKSLGLVGLAGWEDTPVSALSTSMKQRVGLARALTSEADILLMDEPFAALEPTARRDMRFELMSLQKKLGKTIVFVTQDVEEAFKLGDRIAVMWEGRVLRVGAPQQILTEPGDAHVRDFVMEIDRTKVLTAQNIMSMPAHMIRVTDGPHTALKEMKNGGISSVYTVGHNMKLAGIITLDAAMESINSGRPLREFIESDSIITTAPDTLLSELVPLAVDTRYPIAVADDSGRFLGIVTRAAVMASMV